MLLNDRSAMIFAAGLGTRMQPLTDNCPKPLVKVGGRSFLERSLDHVTEANIQKTVVNAFYYPEMIKDALDSYPHVHISEEPQRLETGGGAKYALPALGKDAFFTLNGDAIWQAPNLLTQLHDAWNDSKMDALLLLVPTEEAHGHKGRGDFLMDPEQKLERYTPGEGKCYIYAGCQMVHPKLFEDTPSIFSMNVLWDKAIESGRLYGQILKGDWYHLSTVTDLEEWEPRIAAQEEERRVSGGRL